MNQPQRQLFPAILFAGLHGHIFVSVPLLLYVLSSIDGRIVFYVLLLSFQFYVCTLVCLALFIHEEVTSSLVIGLLRLFSALCWGGICFMVYALVGSVIYARIQKVSPRPGTPPVIARSFSTDGSRSRFHACRRPEGAVAREGLNKLPQRGNSCYLRHGFSL